MTRKLPRPRRDVRNQSKPSARVLLAYITLICVAVIIAIRTIFG